ncbi:MAG: cytochrome c oxidase assembly protein [Phenylobacterium sp.]
MSQAGPSKPQRTPQQRRNRVVGLATAAVFAGMVGAAYAAVPLYKAFCQATGYDGTVRKAAAAPDKVLDHQVTVRFDVNVRDLPWDFTAEQVSQPVKIGETKVALFKVTNHSDKPVTGRAVFNVVPEQSAVYFHKLSCFCFSDQTIGPHQTVEMPVLYFIDPKWMNDFETRTQKDVTLSYTFYPAVDAKPQTAAAGPTAKLGKPG